MAEKQAYELLAEAEKKMSPRGFLRSFFAPADRTEDAIECYQKAGNLFKMSKNWPQAASTFKAAAELHSKMNNRLEAAQSYTAASKCLQKYDISGAVKMLLSAIEIYTDLGRFVMAAKLHQSIAEIHEELMEYEKAVQHYEQAADYFKVDDGYSSAKKCMLKVAQFASAEFGEYDKAINIYEEVALHDLKSPILHFNARDNFFKAILCHLCIDFLNAKHYFDSYVAKCPEFTTSREYKFLEKLIECAEGSDEDGFQKILNEYDQVSRFNSWHIKVLKRIKEKMSAVPDLL